MKPARPISVEESGAFVETFELDPTGAGPLDGLRFAIKDLIDVAGYTTGCGNPSWREAHPPAAAHAVAVEQIAAAGARCVGKTITDELAFSLLGENYHYGTPLNPRAPARVPGGSSSGSASAVACGLADFALGTDTGGSVRVPASNCGIWGLRPSHGFISVAGVNPLAPTFDTLGVLACSADVLARAASVLLACAVPKGAEPGAIHLLREGFEIADADVREALAAAVEHLRREYGPRVRDTALREIEGNAESDLLAWGQAFSAVQWREIQSSVGTWVAANTSAFGPVIAGSFEAVKNLDRRRAGDAVRSRAQRFRRLQRFLGPTDLLCIPTTPAFAPLKGSIVRRDQDATKYYPRALSLTAIAGMGRLPQVSMPLGERNGVPVGLSLLAAHGRDDFLLSVVQRLAELQL
ncbi:MAG: amidase [Candidatus Binatia bacterium]